MKTYFLKQHSDCTYTCSEAYQRLLRSLNQTRHKELKAYSFRDQKNYSSLYKLVFIVFNKHLAMYRSKWKPANYVCLLSKAYV